jgi:glycosyltransferase involved in cell wall biosynthesis
MEHIRQMVERVDIFIAPSKYLRNRFVDEFRLPSDKVVYLDYGFDHERLKGRSRLKEEAFVFGYIGTHTIPKGIPLLIEAFGQVGDGARLRIWGRENGHVTATMKEMARNLPGDRGDYVEWRGEYNNDHIVREVFNNVDAIVVPSIWVENSPLVIHEAQQARVPVITSDLGGMSEYVRHEVNGLLFAPRKSEELARQMRRLVDNPELARRLGRRGYLESAVGDVPSIETHVEKLVELYESASRSRLISA